MNTQEVEQTKTKRSLLVPMIITIVVLVVIVGGIALFDLYNFSKAKKMFANFQPPPVTISATKATSKTWKPFLSAVGSVVAIKGVDVNPQIPGQIEVIYFHSGDMVTKGTPLLKLNDAVDQQDLKSFRAKLALAKLSYDRQHELYRKGATSKSNLDSARSQLEESEAAVNKTQVVINEKNIKAPFSGKLGIRQVNIGQYLTAGQAIVSLQALKPLYINFSLPEQDLKKLYSNQPVTITTDAFPDQQFLGRIHAINSTVDPKTRNILVQAVVPNNDKKLYPGMFANVKVILPLQENVVTVPETAIAYTLYGDSIFVIKSDKGKDGKQELKAYKQYVTVGEHRGNEVAITKGIKTGDMVVTSGQLKLQDKSRVVINNSVTTNKAPVIPLN